LPIQRTALTRIDKDRRTSLPWRWRQPPSYTFIRTTRRQSQAGGNLQRKEVSLFEKASWKLAGAVWWSQRSTEPRLQMLEAGQYLKKYNSSAPRPRIWFGAGKTAGPNLKRKIMLRHRSFVTLHIVFHTSEVRRTDCYVHITALWSDVINWSTYAVLTDLCKIFCTLQAQRRREIFK